MVGLPERSIVRSGLPGRPVACTFPGIPALAARSKFQSGLLGGTRKHARLVAHTFPGQHSLPGRSKVRSGLQEGKEGLWPSLIDLSYQVGAKFRVVYQEGLWILAHTWFTREEQSLEWPTRRQGRSVARTFPGQLSLPGRSKVHSGLQEGKEGLLSSLIDLFYQVGAKFGVAYQEGL